MRKVQEGQEGRGNREQNGYPVLFDKAETFFGLEPGHGDLGSPEIDGSAEIIGQSINMVEREES